MGYADGEQLAGAVATERPRSRGAVLARAAGDHPGQLLAVAGGLAFLLAFVNVRAVAAGLGASASDLGLTTNDYLVSATGWVFLFVPFVAGYAWLQGLAGKFGWLSWTGLSTAAGAAGTAVVVVVTTGTSVSTRWAVLMAAAIAIAAAIGWWLGGPGLCVVATLAVAVLGVGPPASYTWAQSIRDDPTQSAATPIWLKLVLAVEEGRAEFPTGAECALRVSDRVHVTRSSVRIEAAAVPFRVRRCFDAR